MAKKKDEEQEEKLVLEESERLSVGSESPSPLAPLPLGEGNSIEYEKKSWMGKTLYVCSTCIFDTLDETAMLEHLIGAHNSESALKKFYTSAPDGSDADDGSHPKE